MLRIQQARTGNENSMGWDGTLNFWNLMRMPWRNSHGNFIKSKLEICIFILFKNSSSSKICKIYLLNTRCRSITLLRIASKELRNKHPRALRSPTRTLVTIMRFSQCWIPHSNMTPCRANSHFQRICWSGEYAFLWNISWYTFPFNETKPALHTHSAG